jgi:CubicO group peptidase (beta-lactamase class C family)
MCVRRLSTIAGVALSLSSSALAAQASLRDPVPALDAYIARARETWQVPGLAIAIVKGDSIVLLRGYGVRELGKPEPVDEGTLFAIGSCSKAFTATLVGLLVGEGKLRWDDPATRYLPGFQLYDPYVTRELTIRDLLTHRSGLSRGDLMWYASPYDRAEVLRRIRFLQPTWSFRSSFGYQNVMYLAAGPRHRSVLGTTGPRATLSAPGNDLNQHVPEGAGGSA